MIVSRTYLSELLNQENGNRSALYWVVQPSLNSTDPNAHNFTVNFISKILRSPKGLDSAILTDIYRTGVKLKLDDLLRGVHGASVTISATDELLVTISELVKSTFRGESSAQPEWDTWYVL